jgi:hypothetical protein
VFNEGDMTSFVTLSKRAPASASKCDKRELHRDMSLEANECQRVRRSMNNESFIRFCRAFRLRGVRSSEITARE